MTKIRIEEINHCWACPDCVTYDITEMACGCRKMGYRLFNKKEVDSQITNKYFPSWCPLPDKQEKGDDNGK